VTESDIPDCVADVGVMEKTRDKARWAVSLGRCKRLVPTYFMSWQARLQNMHM
jgi:hypothetical protein